MRADSDLSAAVAILKDTNGDPVFAKKLDLKLINAVEKARTLHQRLDQSKAQRDAALKARKAWGDLNKWVVANMSQDDIDELAGIGRTIDFIIDLKSPRAVHYGLGTTRQTGTGDRDRDQLAAQFAIGALAYWVKKMNPRNPQTTMLAKVADALFNPDQSLFVTRRKTKDNPAGKPKAKSLGPEDIEDAREAYAKLMELPPPWLPKWG